MKRLTPASLTMIMFLMIGGLVVAYVAKGLLAVEKPKSKIAVKNIPMAVTDIQPGTVLTEQHIGLGPIMESDLRPDMLLNNRVIVGRVVKETLRAARPIVSAQLYEPGAGPPLKIQPGMRAVTIDFAASSAIVEGFAKPGDYCDVHMTINEVAGDDRYTGGLTLTLFKGVRILAVNRLTQQAQIERESNSVTLELTSGQANIALLAAKKGQLSLTANPHGKGPGGIAVQNQDRVMLYEILGLEPRKLPPEPFTAQIYHGARRNTIQFRGNQITEVGGGSNAPVPASPNPLTPTPAAVPSRTPAASAPPPVGQPSASMPNPADYYSGPLRFGPPLQSAGN